MLTKHKSSNTKDRENNENAIQIQKIFKKKEEPLCNNWSFNIGHIPNTYMVNSTNSFLSKINSFSFCKDDFLISFDVESLFTNVPLLDTINIIADSIYDDPCKSKPPFCKSTFIKLLKFATGGLFLFKDGLYKQSDGVTMGSPLGPTLANFFLAHLENQWLCNSNSSISIPHFYTRYVDDIFCIFKNGNDFNDFLSLLNNTHPNLKFTFVKGSSSLPFLDVLVTLPTNSEEKIQTSVFRKPTFTGQLLNFSSICPFTWKISLIYCFLHRAYLICSSWDLFHKEVSYLHNIFVKNGYPSDIFYSVLKRFVSSKYCSNNCKTPVENSRDVICIPYLGKCSLIYKKKLSSIFSSFNCNCSIVFRSHKVKNYFSLKSLSLCVFVLRWFIYSNVSVMLICFTLVKLNATCSQG